MANIDIWVRILQEKPNNRTGWTKFYKEQLGQPVSDYSQLSWCIENYGFWPTFEAVIAATRRKGQTTDPLPYVLAVAQSKWKDSFMQLSDDGKYDRGIQRSKQSTVTKNEELEEKLRKAREQ